jgi:hypothetical protein
MVNTNIYKVCMVLLYMFKKRVVFPDGECKRFFEKVIDKLLAGNLRGLLQFGFNVKYSALKKYYYGYLLLPHDLFLDLCYISGLHSYKKQVKVVDGNWGQVKGGINGMESMSKKYPKEVVAWRKKGADKIAGANVKKIIYPKLSEDLAEFIGIHLGDGTMTKYFIRISGDYRCDIPYFKYISNLIFKLFGIRPQIFKDPRPINTGYVLLRSKAVCSFLNEKYGIPFGDKIKSRAHIPHKILEDERLSFACLRGLVDTDGSVSRRGVGGRQFCIHFTSHNPGLLSQVRQITEGRALFTHFYEKSSGTNCWSSILKYFKMVGSSNMRHIVRFHQRTLGNTLYQKEVVNYYGQNLYKQLDLPFKGLVV